MHTLERALDIGCVVAVLVLSPCTVSAPVVVRAFGESDAVVRAYWDSARTLDELCREERLLIVRGQLADADERFLGVDPASSRLWLNWGAARLGACGLDAERVSDAEGGLLVVTWKAPGSTGLLRLSNGVEIRGVDDNWRTGPIAFLAKTDLEAVLDFVEMGTKVIWEF